MKTKQPLALVALVLLALSMVVPVQATDTGENSNLFATAGSKPVSYTHLRAHET